MRSNTSTSRIASMAMRMAPSAAPATRSGTLTLRPTIPLTIIRNTPLIKAPRRYKNCNECDPGLRRWNFRIVREERDGLRRYRHCNANSANVVENRRKKPVMNPMTTATNRQTYTARSNVLVEKKSVIGDGPKDWSAGLAKSASDCRKNNERHR